MRPGFRHLEEHSRPCGVGQRVERSRDHREARLVTDEQVVGRRRVRGPGAAWSAESDGVPGSRGRCPRTGEPLVTMHHDVEVHLRPRQVQPADRVGPGDRSLLPRGCYWMRSGSKGQA